MKRGIIFLVLLIIPLVLAEDIQNSPRNINIEDTSSRLLEENYYSILESNIVAKVNNDVEYLHRDRLGSNIATTGNDLKRNKNLPFGQEISNDGITYSFTGKELDDNDLYYFVNRYYNPDSGRFLETDSVYSNPSYVYANNNPLLYVDPDGRDIKNILKLMYEKSGFKAAVGIVTDPGADLGPNAQIGQPRGVIEYVGPGKAQRMSGFFKRLLKGRIKPNNKELGFAQEYPIAYNGLPAYANKATTPAKFDVTNSGIGNELREEIVERFAKTFDKSGMGNGGVFFEHTGEVTSRYGAFSLKNVEEANIPIEAAENLFRDLGRVAGKDKTLFILDPKETFVSEHGQFFFNKVSTAVIGASPGTQTSAFLKNVEAILPSLQSGGLKSQFGSLKKAFVEGIEQGSLSQ